MAKLWRSRPVVPPELAEELGVGRDRVLAWSWLAGGGAAAALVTGLRIVTPRGERLAHEWMDVDHATWDQDSSMLLVWWVGTRGRHRWSCRTASAAFPRSCGSGSSPRCC